MENMLATVDKVFKVELMKMPPALQNTVTWDLISGETLLIIKLKEFTRSKMSAEIHNLFIFLRPTLLSNRSCVLEEEISASEVSIAMKVS